MRRSGRGSMFILHVMWQTERAPGIIANKHFCGLFYCLLISEIGYKSKKNVPPRIC